MSEKSKPYIPIDNQIKTLENRGLIINNKEFVKKKLLRTTYYDLINGYKNMFLVGGDSEEEKYIQDVTFEDILDLYNYDRQLRYMTLELILDIEAVFYSSISHSISHFYGEKSDAYLNKNNYRIGVKQKHNNKYERDNLLDRLNKKINQPEVEPLIYYRNKYRNIPPWILVKDMTFGELKIFYKLSMPGVKSKILSDIISKENITELDKNFFTKAIGLFNKFRNWCAHGGRVYTYKADISLPYYREFHERLNISKKAYQRGKGRNDISALLIASLYFFQSDYRGLLEFRVKLEGYLNDYKKGGYMQYQTLLEEMGLPDNYIELLDKAMHISSVEIPQQ
ncbi:Abi-like protein [Oceanobacillus oncorhynchi]|uniref:Abi-like protein n=1 Tax=Oceanobacillus oncorhynchi TaxID=545501 RepID=A0A0A1M7R3_9BACI|nr:Abi family protein [Oceanobacillus oncorhynchi]CEI81320.1 Abi-like protein [Oceanobacillus oncorhynchi]